MFCRAFTFPWFCLCFLFLILSHWHFQEYLPCTSDWFVISISWRASPSYFFPQLILLLRDSLHYLSDWSPYLLEIYVEIYMIEMEMMPMVCFKRIRCWEVSTGVDQVRLALRFLIFTYELIFTKDFSSFGNSHALCCTSIAREQIFVFFSYIASLISWVTILRIGILSLFLQHVTNINWDLTPWLKV